jgi:glutamate-ammonia-ligase adenylyltransferase
MSERLERLLEMLPPPLRAANAGVWQQIAANIPEAQIDSMAVSVLPRVLACCRYACAYLLQHPQVLKDLLNSGDVNLIYVHSELQDSIESTVVRSKDETELRAQLRRIRHREMIRIAWRDIGGLSDLHTTIAETSWLADALIDSALAWLYAQMTATHGVPADAAGNQQRLFVIAMGKLGGEELNFSSDVDLIFGFPSGGQTSGANRSLSNQEFFDRLGRKLISVLQDVDGDGFAFRVDMRLRPFGDSGALAQSVAAMESYYAAHAREWERYALVKARVCAGDRKSGEALLQTLQPFVYRRYVDFGVFQSLREMKALIRAEVERREMHADVKRGAGGIREVEFIAQMFQLVRGGREPVLRVRATCAVLKVLYILEEMPAAAAEELIAAYEFLRNTEHRLQQLDDRQTQALPDAEQDQLLVAYGMGFDSWQHFAAELHRHRSNVERHFNELLQGTAVAAPTAEPTSSAQLSDLWQNKLSPPHALAALRTAGFANPESALREIVLLRGSAEIGRLSSHGQERLQKLMPRLLTTVAGQENELEALQRIFRLIEAVARRSVYLSLLTEQPQALQHLARLMAASPWIAGSIVKQPILLDELLDPRSLYAPPQAAELEQSLRNEVAKHPFGDLEHQMEALRHFRHAEVLKVAAADLTGQVPLPEVSNHLSWIAEAVLRMALELAWAHLIDRHGEPSCVVDGEARTPGFAIIAYGKLGGLELGYGSDLDLVFLHDSHGDAQTTNGSRSIDNATFFTRLGQRIIHLISTLTPAGIAYEIDTRLRPSGASGLLVSSGEAFARYQQEQAWTWEHQALVRARKVATVAGGGEAFERVRATVLSRLRDRAVLRREIVDMRGKMRAEHAARKPGIFDLKHDVGGITDIEFMVQYGVLAFAGEHPALLAWTDNKRLLEVFGDCGILPRSSCEQLRDAYFSMRHRIHRCALQEQPAEVPENEFQAERQAVSGLWNEMFVDVI